MLNTETIPFNWEPMQVRMDRWNGTDLDVVNAARRSFGDKSEWVWEDEDGPNPVRTLNVLDKGLISFLGRGMRTRDFEAFVENVAAAGWHVHEEWHQAETDKEVLADRTKYLIDLMWKWRDESIHDTPFNHVGAHFSIMVPVFVARQLVKTEYMPWSEISRRYKGAKPEDREHFSYWKPGLGDGLVWRSAPGDDIKQGSGAPLPDDVQHAMDMTVSSNTLDAHRRLIWALESGVCLEQARMLLPANLMVEVTWSGFLGAICKMLRERTGAHAQEETRWVANAMLLRMRSRFPESVAALVR